jgi:hypothetical protein
MDVSIRADRRTPAAADRPAGRSTSISQEVDLDKAGRHLGILGAGRAIANLAVNANHEFRGFSASRKAGEPGSTTHWVIP